MAMSYTVRAEDPARTQMTVDAETLEAAVEAAWRLQRFYETPVLIVDAADGRALARVNIEWLDGA